MKTNIQQNIPQGWELKALGDLGEFKTGGVDKKIKQDEQPVKLINYMDVYRHKFIDRSINFMEVTANEGEIESSQVKIGDMLFTPSSETHDDIGHSAVVVENLPNTLFSYHLARLRFNEVYNKKINLNFRAYFCNSRLVLKQFEKMSVGATRYTISKGKFESIQVLIPSSNIEQRKIAEILGAVDEDIAKTQDVIDATEKLKRGLMQQLFTRGIGNAEFKTLRLGDLCIFQTGKLNSNRAVSGGEYLFFTCSQETFEIDQYSFDQKAILLAGNNAAGKYSVKYYEGKFDAYQRTYVISIKNEDELSYPYLKEVLNTRLNELRDSSVGSTTKFLTLKLLENLPISLPSITQQREIAEILSTINEKISINKKLKAKLTLLKRGLMQDLLSGNKRVKI